MPSLTRRPAMTRLLAPVHLARLAVLGLVLLFSSATLAFSPFVVKDIRVDGIQRTETGIVFAYIPVTIG